MVRINGVGTGFEEADVDEVVSSPAGQFLQLAHDFRNWSELEGRNGLLTVQLRTRNVQALALPKTTHPDHLAWLISRIEKLCPRSKQKGGEEAIRIIGMIENARGMVGIEEIAQSGEGHLDALLVSGPRTLSG